LRILILGGYGTFGGRLARLLADDSRLTLLIAGRSALAYPRERPSYRRRLIAMAMWRRNCKAPRRPLPLWLAPGGTAFEFAVEGRFHFDVEIRHWLTGLIVRYHGWLAPRDVPQ